MAKKFTITEAAKHLGISRVANLKALRELRKKAKKKAKLEN
jgi:hypothetical protein